MFQVYYKYPTVRDLTAEGTKAQDLEGSLHSTHLCKAPTVGILLALTLGFRPTPPCLQPDGIAMMLHLGLLQCSLQCHHLLAFADMAFALT